MRSVSECRALNLWENSQKKVFEQKSLPRTLLRLNWHILEDSVSTMLLEGATGNLHRVTEYSTAR